MLKIPPKIVITGKRCEVIHTYIFKEGYAVMGQHDPHCLEIKVSEHDGGGVMRNGICILNTFCTGGINHE